VTLLDLALLCLRLGFLSFGGGVATLAEMQHVVVDVHGAMTAADFGHAFGLGQATPGPGVLYLVPLGVMVSGPAGGAVALVAFVLPPLVLAAIVVRVWDRFADSPWTVAANRTLAPLSIGLIAGGLRTIAAPLVGDPLALVGVLVALVALLRLRLSPPIVVVSAGIVWLLAST
jgi:chromate transporter